jgi:hypothetical protein
MSKTSPSTFIAKVFEIFNDPGNSDMCGWNQQGQTIFVSKVTMHLNSWIARSVP